MRFSSLISRCIVLCLAAQASVFYTLSHAGAPATGSAPLALRMEYSEQMPDLATGSGYNQILPAPKFTKEPAFSGGEIQRGHIPLGDNNAARGIGFALDGKAGKLYLDLNRNLDLTDDAPPIRKTNDKAAPSRLQFNDVRIPLQGTQPAKTCLFDVEFLSARQLYVALTLRSHWRGTLNLGGRSWTFIAQDTNFDGKFNQYDKLIPPDVPQFGPPYLPEYLVLGAQTFRVMVASQPEKQGAALKLALDPSFPSDVHAGELRLPGKGIHFLSLQANRGIYLIDPVSPVKLPAAWHYSVTTCVVRPTGSGPDLTANYPNLSATVEANRSRELLIGGPVKGALTVTANKQYLDLDFHLLGLGNEVYNTVASGNPPTFEVFKNGRQIAAGKFEYG